MLSHLKIVTIWKICWKLAASSIDCRLSKPLHHPWAFSRLSQPLQKQSVAQVSDHFSISPISQIQSKERLNISISQCQYLNINISISISQYQYLNININLSKSISQSDNISNPIKGEAGQQNVGTRDRVWDLQLRQEQPCNHQHIYQGWQNPRNSHISMNWTGAVQQAVPKDRKDEQDRLHRQLWWPLGPLHGLQVCSLCLCVCGAHMCVYVSVCLCVCFCVCF